MLLVINLRTNHLHAHRTVLCGAYQAIIWIGLYCSYSTLLPLLVALLEKQIPRPQFHPRDTCPDRFFRPSLLLSNTPFPAVDVWLSILSGRISCWSFVILIGKKHLSYWLLWPTTFISVSTDRECVWISAYFGWLFELNHFPGAGFNGDFLWPYLNPMMIAFLEQNRFIFSPLPWWITFTINYSRVDFPASSISSDLLLLLLMIPHSFLFCPWQSALALHCFQFTRMARYKHILSV